MRLGAFFAAVFGVAFLAEAVAFFRVDLAFAADGFEFCALRLAALRVVVPEALALAVLAPEARRLFAATDFDRLAVSLVAFCLVRAILISKTTRHRTQSTWYHLASRFPGAPNAQCRNGL